MWGLAVHDFRRNGTIEPPDAVKDCALHAMDAVFWMFLSTDLAELVIDGGSSPRPFSFSMTPKAFLGGVVSTAHAVIGWSWDGEKLRDRKLIYHAVRLLVVFIEVFFFFFFFFVCLFVCLFLFLFLFFFHPSMALFF